MLHLPAVRTREGCVDRPDPAHELRGQHVRLLVVVESDIVWHRRRPTHVDARDDAGVEDTVRQPRLHTVALGDRLAHRERLGVGPGVGHAVPKLFPASTAQKLEPAATI